MTDAGVISGVTVSHTLASVAEIESAGGGAAVRETVAELRARDGVTEAFALSTCNRVEAYVVTEDAATGRRALAEFAPDVRDGAVVRLDHEESLRHLMRVAAGLESLVLGEDQILGQVKRALSESRAAGGIGPVLEEAVMKAVHVGERARSETAINEGSLSLGSAAVDLAARETTLAGATALVVGAGEMGALAARELDDSPVDRVVLANRTLPHAEHVAADLDTDAVAVGLDAAPAATDEADVVIAATAADGYVLDAGDLAGAGETVCIDLGQPRDVDPAADDGAVTVHDIDALEAVTAETRTRRRAEAETVESMIDAEFDRLLEAFKRKRADEAISAMYESAERTKAREVEEALTKLDAQGGLTAEQRETVEGLADALVGQLLAAPTRSLREAAAEDDWSTIHTAMQLFDPEFDRPSVTDDAPSGGQGAAGVSERSDD
ncbi:glutamyl-tRNA reductase [Candidatus Halobonum tyrrellensis]|uniref:Glutamyl-tRNA reductase n=1 Tax=Candidatus Halobonum tyrrellensis G22 TaxID=1324957 RepID=V4H9N8_9EURY|nr:glutamyl-tRNA reductase [Candidatus Halobonum tyrrellensis]ESP87395.1 glutamyl-tRNA reductase [Candidatus Halobonum tyrrellensis G22]